MGRHHDVVVETVSLTMIRTRVMRSTSKRQSHTIMKCMTANSNSRTGCVFRALHQFR